MLVLAIRVAALVPLIAGLAGAIGGASFLGEVAGPATDSHLRYLSGLLLGLGILAWWCAADLKRRGEVFTILVLIVALGGLARLAGVVGQGRPPMPHLLALGMELGVTPALWLWWRLARGEAETAAGSEARPADLYRWLGGA
ncbi:DUF4345 domain-containing protein [Roseomonas stagni]|uniref:DUF4345 domain-containing protein n=1 Tax=Falsiroseomonas algicola TaxID=2716930 RepID=A0A6M1LGF5_9PROT|nr:DUF4345 family protein [Falsiroseomonas algicola]NGM19271.1 DUF4345 domain-containing protein [Falsiroseomonas algicola]